MSEKHATHPGTHYWTTALSDEDLQKLSSGVPAWEIRPEHFQHLAGCECPKCRAPDNQSANDLK